ncbi:MAG: porin [Leptothrix sp. (in: Bacteria)]|nr:porin [Leptothrix sp. (in: b-proteobacteria)]
MNKTLAIAAVAALTTTGALAQSSVTVYGRLNLTAERQDINGKKLSVLANNASRMGFKGTEDLGGGMKAGFNLESGFSADTGAVGSSFFNRQSEVNLQGGFGMLRLGNFISEAYFASADYISMHNHDTGSSSDALYFANWARSTNKVAYRIPELAKGMTLEAAISLGEGVAGRKRAYDVAWNYSMGALQLGAGYEKNDTNKQYVIRGLYEMGAVVLGAYLQRDTNGYASGNRTTYRLSGAYNLGASEFHLNFGGAGKYSNVPNSKASQYTVGYNYNLSKRTKVYGYYTGIDDSAAKVYGGDFNSFALGIRHNF